MKRVAFTLLVIMAFAFVLPVCASAKEANDLAGYGQKTYELKESYTPLVDGNIDEGEYELMIPAVIENDTADDNFYVSGILSLTDAEYVNFYLAADDEKLYFAVEQKDPLRVGHYDALYLQVGAGATDSYIQIYLPFNAPPEVLTQKNDRASWTKYYENYAASFTEDMTYYEISMPKSIVCKTFSLDDCSELLVSMAHRVHYDAEKGAVAIVFGFENSSINTEHATQGYPVSGYPHILKINGETADSEGSTPVTLPEMIIPETEPEPEPEPVESEKPIESETEKVFEEPAGCGATVVSPVVLLVGLALITTFSKKKLEDK